MVASILGRTGTWAWYATTGAMFWSPETFRILGLDPRTTRPSLEILFGAIHPDERPAIGDAFSRAARGRREFEHEYSILRPDGVSRHVHCLASPVVVQSGLATEYVGAIRDITERWAAEEAMRSTRAELARVSRVLTMGALAASIAHEVNQPLAAVITNGNAGLRWLKGAKPRVDKARKALAGIVRDGARASEVVARIRTLAKKGTDPERMLLDVNSVAREIVALTRAELRACGARLRLRLAHDLPPILGDAVQLQQVFLNLVMNAVEAMSSVTGRPKELVIGTRRSGRDSIRVTVRDSGVGFEAQGPEQIFEPFYTTKPQGMGIGLALSRAIVEEHGGRLWAVNNADHGATFHFTVPVGARG